MKKLPSKYLIVEIIPSSSKKETGKIVQIQALKIKNDKIIDRLDVRMIKDIHNDDLLKMISYDQEMFDYLNSEEELKKTFLDFIQKDKLFIIDNYYTLDYLSDIKNTKESIFPYLNLSYCSDIFDKIIEKYKLEPTNHLVDLLYEALMFEKESK